MTTKQERDLYKQEYSAWTNMKSRCVNEKHHAYSRYGGRGISVCVEWRDSFHAFIADVGPIPNKETRWSLDRLDVNGNYEPSNVKWVTYSDQAQNRRKQSRNKSGKTGVCKVVKGKYEYYVAFWSDLDGVNKEKTFSTLKFGDERAFEMATEHRSKMINVLNQKGANYSDKHGD